VTTGGLGLEGRRVLVTGGTRGIGRAIVLAFAGAGAHVVTCSTSPGEAVDSLERELKAGGGNHRVVRADVSRPDDVDGLVRACADTFGGLDVVVNNAGTISHHPFAELALEEWRRVVDVDLTGAFLVTQRALPLLGHGSSVVFVGSRVATEGVPLRAHYTAAKAGLIGLTRTLAKELGPSGVRVNLVAPGPVATEAEVPEAVVERYRSLIALGRLGRPEEIASAVLYLAGPRAAFVSGEILHVDGGI
jgi:3-oxoacyl-[acyl-carrier protein] reductase